MAVGGAPVSGASTMNIVDGLSRGMSTMTEVGDCSLGVGTSIRTSDGETLALTDVGGDAAGGILEEAHAASKIDNIYHFEGRKIKMDKRSGNKNKKTINNNKVGQGLTRTGKLFPQSMVVEPLKCNKRKTVDDDNDDSEVKKTKSNRAQNEMDCDRVTKTQDYDANVMSKQMKLVVDKKNGLMNMRSGKTHEQDGEISETKDMDDDKRDGLIEQSACDEDGRKVKTMVMVDKCRQLNPTGDETENALERVEYSDEELSEIRPVLLKKATDLLHNCENAKQMTETMQIPTVFVRLLGHAEFSLRNAIKIVQSKQFNIREVTKLIESTAMFVDRYFTSVERQASILSENGEVKRNAQIEADKRDRLPVDTDINGKFGIEEMETEMHSNSRLSMKTTNVDENDQNIKTPIDEQQCNEMDEHGLMTALSGFDRGNDQSCQSFMNHGVEKDVDPKDVLSGIDEAEITAKSASRSDGKCSTNETETISLQSTKSDTAIKTIGEEHDNSYDGMVNNGATEASNSVRESLEKDEDATIYERSTAGFDSRTTLSELSPNAKLLRITDNMLANKGINQLQIFNDSYVQVGKQLNIQNEEDKMITIYKKQMESSDMAKVINQLIHFSLNSSNSHFLISAYFKRTDVSLDKAADFFGDLSSGKRRMAMDLIECQQLNDLPVEIESTENIKVLRNGNVREVLQQGYCIEKECQRLILQFKALSEKYELNYWINIIEMKKYTANQLISLKQIESWLQDLNTEMDN